MPDLEYPQNTIWYVEAEEMKQCGSAVAVCLFSQAKDLPAERYLLTLVLTLCAGHRMLGSRDMVTCFRSVYGRPE